MMASLIEEKASRSTLHSLGLIFPQGGTWVVMVPLRPSRAEGGQAGGKYAAGPAQGLCPQEGWVLACPLLATSQAGSGLLFTSDGALGNSQAGTSFLAFDLDCIEGELVLPFCHFLSLISQLGLNTGRLLAGLVTTEYLCSLCLWAGVGNCLTADRLSRHTLGSTLGRPLRFHVEYTAGAAVR